MEIVEISSFSEYVDFVEQISSQYSLSRGQEKDKDLLPSILRKNEEGMSIYTKANAKSFIDDNATFQKPSKIKHSQLPKR